MPVIQDTVFLGGKNSGSNRCQRGTFCDGQQEGMVRTGVYMPSPRVTFSVAWQICNGVLWNRMHASLQQFDGLKYNVCVPVYTLASLKKEQAITVQKSTQAQTMLESHAIGCSSKSVHAIEEGTSMGCMGQLVFVQSRSAESRCDYTSRESARVLSCTSCPCSG